MSLTTATAALGTANRLVQSLPASGWTGPRGDGFPISTPGFSSLAHLRQIGAAPHLPAARKRQKTWEVSNSDRPNELVQGAGAAPDRCTVGAGGVSASGCRGKFWWGTASI